MNSVTRGFILSLSIISSVFSAQRRSDRRSVAEPDRATIMRARSAKAKKPVTHRMPDSYEKSVGIFNESIAEVRAAAAEIVENPGFLTNLPEKEKQAALALAEDIAYQKENPFICPAVAKDQCPAYGLSKEGEAVFGVFNPKDVTGENAEEVLETDE